MARRHFAPLFALTLAISAVLAACAGGDGAPSSAGDGGGGGGTDAGETVSLAGGRFSPASLTISAGTSVTFTDTSNHTVTEGTNGTAVDDPIVDEEGGEDVVVTFDEPGTYNITCRIHPNMNMTVTVEG
jgi:plastocyanin